MEWVFAVPVLGFLVFLVIGAITGHVRLRSCCSVADPRRDSRMREALLEDANEPMGSGPGRSGIARAGSFLGTPRGPGSGGGLE